MPSYFNPYQYTYPLMQYQPTQPVPANVSQPQQNQQQIQNGGFVSVPGEADARNYPVAQGMSITFKDEKLPYIYTKTMGFSQLDRPIFEKFRLVKEDAIESPITHQNESEQANTDNTAIEKLENEIEALWKEIEALKEQPKKPTGKKKEVTADDPE